MTRDELIRRLNRCHDVSAGDAARLAYAHAATLAEELDSPPAMTWQDEPSAIGLHYVEGLIAPVPLIRDANRTDRPWVYWDVKYNRSEQVGRRRVCPIPAPPALPKRGEE